MKQFDNAILYHCRACGVANPKEEWQLVNLPHIRLLHICPNCGVLMDLSVANVVDDPPVQEPDAPEPAKPTPKKK